jgi:hypothetical protein
LAGTALKPHLIRTFKISKDPNFAETVHGVIVLYLNPPEHALVLCCHENATGPPLYLLP